MQNGLLLHRYDRKFTPVGARSPGQKFGVCKYNTPEKKFIGSYQNKTPDNFLKMEHLQNSRSISDKTPGGF